MAEQQTAGSRVWMARAPSLEDLGQAGVDVPLGGDGLPFLERDRIHMYRFGEDDHGHLFGNASRSLKFHMWASHLEKARLKATFFHFRVICVYTSPVD